MYKVYIVLPPYQYKQENHQLYIIVPFRISLDIAAMTPIDVCKIFSKLPTL